MDAALLKTFQEGVRPTHTELLPTIFLSQDTLDSIRYTRWQGNSGDDTDTVSFIAVLKNGKELVLIKNVPSEVIFSYIENHPSAPGPTSRSASRSSSDESRSRSRSSSEYESDDDDNVCNCSGKKCKCDGMEMKTSDKNVGCETEAKVETD